uniref:BTB domain-containing protein n=1 Tax=Panagrolaimus davidi TaxID=227884 RepID=A0A914QH77_9BILA
MTTLKRKLMKEDRYPISIKWILKHDTMLGTRTIKISSFDYDIPNLPNVKYSIHLNLDKESTSTIHLGLRMPEDMKISVAEIHLSCNNNILRNCAAEYENLEGPGPIYKELCVFNDLEDFIMDKEELIFIISATLTLKNAEPIEAKKPKFDKSLGYMLWESKVDKDVTIAHKCVLKRRSSKFAKMLDVNAEPDTAAAAATTQSTIVIQNKTFDTVKEAIMHCYDIQNSDTLSAEDAANILIFAAEYEIEDLKVIHILLFKN